MLAVKDSESALWKCKRFWCAFCRNVNNSRWHGARRDRGRTDLPASQPARFLECRVHRIAPNPGLSGVCAGYESNDWRAQQLARHLIEWLPDFALTYSELQSLGPHNAVNLVGQAALSVYESTNIARRGELGELLLHVMLRQVFNTLPAISKYFYKDSRNDTVKGFDNVHVVVEGEDLQLWLGEVKFYTDIGAAIRDVIPELIAHTTRDYLRAEFTAITNKIDPSWPHADRLKKLLDRNTSLDEVFRAVCIPVLLTYDSAVINDYTEVTAAFLAAFEQEVSEHHRDFAGRSLPIGLTIHLFLFPMKRKADLVLAFDEKLRACQALA